MSNNVVIKGIETKQGLSNEGQHKELELEDGLLLTKSNILGNTNADGSGNAHHLHIDANGNARVSLISSVNTIPANSVNSGITDDPANSMAVGLRARQTITDATSETFLQCNSQGRLLVDVVELAQSGKITASTSLSSVQICGFNNSDNRFKTLNCDGDGNLSTHSSSVGTLHTGTLTATTGSNSVDCSNCKSIIIYGSSTVILNSGDIHIQGSNDDNNYYTLQNAFSSFSTPLTLQGYNVNVSGSSENHLGGNLENPPSTVS